MQSCFIKESGFTKLSLVQARCVRHPVRIKLMCNGLLVYLAFTLH